MPLDERAVALVAHTDVLHRLSINLYIALAILMIDTKISGQAGASGLLTAKMAAL